MTRVFVRNDFKLLIDQILGLNVCQCLHVYRATLICDFILMRKVIWLNTDSFLKTKA